MTAADIAELEDFFNSIELPQTLRISTGVMQLDLPLFVKEKLHLLKTKPHGIYTTQPRYDDLVRIKEILSQK